LGGKKMNINSIELVNFNTLSQPLSINHPYKLVPKFESLLNRGSNLSELGNKIGTEAVTRAGLFDDAMLQALDAVSGYQQYASGLAQAAIVDPDSVDVHDLTIAQAEASLALNITRNILNRIVQGWRDIINTR
jgi:flagellar hook-basal body complex protein FliE